MPLMSSKAEIESNPVTGQLRALINQALDRYSRFGDECPRPLAEAIRYMLLAPGKRVRPLLTLLAAKACGGSIDDALPAACAVEMIHTYTLIHDDLPAMDNDDFRRGQPTCHRRFDEATAILAGDALQTMAFGLIAREVKVDAAACIAALADAAGPKNLIGGQVDDLAGGKGPISLAHLESIHRRKTAALLKVALCLGGMTAGASSDQRQALCVFGENLGLAFQIVDDLLDFCGDSIKMGKQSGKDEQNGTLTYPVLLGEQQSRQRAHQFIDQAKYNLTIFGPAADPLRTVADFVITRNF